ncbi:uncharacterized protein LOC134539624 [Bacillus rossius redtenbacheri]|uniref:uncharacterized protein LOC134539624 n=1 Tax=Bacillus rossius redtenbacheri TaxID=93214 RepID=UPI002FDDF316
MCGREPASSWTAPCPRTSTSWHRSSGSAPGPPTATASHGPCGASALSARRGTATSRTPSASRARLAPRSSRPRFHGRRPRQLGLPRPRKTVKIDVYSFDRRVIRDTIHEFYIVKKVVPTVNKLLPILKEKIGWIWSKSSLCRLLKEMGFVWRKTQDKRVVLLERADIVRWRSKYLTEMKKIRKDGKEKFFLDETWVDTNLTFKKCWQKKDDINCVMSIGNAAHRLIVLNTGLRNGFLPGACVVYKASATVGDYHRQMNSVNFEKWLSEKVLPNLPPASIVVMDNAPYHSKQVDKPPSKYDVKREIVGWLNRNGVECNVTMSKTELLDLLDRHRPQTKRFRVDHLLATQGHRVIRLPPYMCELNAIELAWAKLKRLVRENNTTGELSLQSLQIQTTQAMNSITCSDWEGYCQHVQNTEDKYCKKDHLMDDIQDEFVITIGNDSEDSDTGEGSENSPKNSDGYCSTSYKSNDSVLASPL